MDTCENCRRRHGSVMLRTNGKLLCNDCDQERWVAMDPRRLVTRKADRSVLQ